MKTENSRCLILNADYSPITIVSWQKAIVWSFKSTHKDKLGIEVLDFYDNDFILGTNDRRYRIPAVAKLHHYVKLHNHKVNFSRKNLFIRDDFTCQYCGTKKEINKLTYDHIIPKSIWSNKKMSPTSWTNIVTACVDCNRKKRNRTPKQANMPLRTSPITPNKNIKYLPITSYLLRIRSDIPQEWTLYLADYIST